MGTEVKARSEKPRKAKAAMNVNGGKFNYRFQNRLAIEKNSTKIHILSFNIDNYFLSDKTNTSLNLF